MPFQMALDEILFRPFEEQYHPPILRFYFSSEPWITVGFSDSTLLIKSDILAPSSSPSPYGRRNIPGKICRRLTGGGRVVHGKDLIFSLIARKEDDESFRSVRISYLKIHEAVKCAYEKAGEKPRFFRCDEELPKGKDCFLHPIATDLGLGKRKIAGGAQKRSSGALLHEESLVVPKSVTAERLRLALCEGFEKIFEVTLTPVDLEPGILKRAEALAIAKYFFPRPRRGRG